MWTLIQLMPNDVEADYAGAMRIEFAARYGFVADIFAEQWSLVGPRLRAPKVVVNIGLRKMWRDDRRYTSSFGVLEIVVATAQVADLLTLPFEDGRQRVLDILCEAFRTPGISAAGDLDATVSAIAKEITEQGFVHLGPLTLVCRSSRPCARRASKYGLKLRVSSRGAEIVQVTHPDRPVSDALVLASEPNTLFLALRIGSLREVEGRLLLGDTNGPDIVVEGFAPRL